MNAEAVTCDFCLGTLNIILPSISLSFCELHEFLFIYIGHLTTNSLAFNSGNFIIFVHADIV